MSDNSFAARLHELPPPNITLADIEYLAATCSNWCRVIERVKASVVDAQDWQPKYILVMVTIRADVRLTRPLKHELESAIENVLRHKVPLESFEVAFSAER